MFNKVKRKWISVLLLISLLICIIPSNSVYADEHQYQVIYDDDGTRLYEFWDEESSSYYYVDADEYDQEQAEQKAEEESIRYYSFCTATIPQTEYYYTGKNICPKVTVKNKDGVVLTEGKDYTVTYGRYNYAYNQMISTSTNNARAYDIYIEGKEPYLFDGLLTYYVYVQKTNTITAKTVDKKHSSLKGKNFCNSLPVLKNGMNTVKIKKANKKNLTRNGYLNCVKYKIPKTGTYAFAFSNLKVNDSTHTYAMAPIITLHSSKTNHSSLYEGEAYIKSEWKNSGYCYDNDEYLFNLDYKIYTSNWRSQLMHFMNVTWEDYFNTNYPGQEFHDKYYSIMKGLDENTLTESFINSANYPTNPNRLVYYARFSKGDVVYCRIPNPEKLSYVSADDIYNKNILLEYYYPTTDCTLNVEVKYLTNKFERYYSSANSSEKKAIKRHEDM